MRWPYMMVRPKVEREVSAYRDFVTQLHNPVHPAFHQTHQARVRKAERNIFGCHGWIWWTSNPCR